MSPLIQVKSYINPRGGRLALLMGRDDDERGRAGGEAGGQGQGGSEKLPAGEANGRFSFVSACSRSSL
jgi:hypothetical protein